MSQPKPSQPGKPKIFFLHKGTPPGDSGSASSGGSSQDEGGNSGPIPARLLAPAPGASNRTPAPTQPAPGAASAYLGGVAQSYYAAPPPPPIELKFPKNALERRRRAAAGGISGAPPPTDARFGGAGHSAGTAYAGGGWQAGPAMHAAGSDQPGPSNFAGSLGNPVYPSAHGHLPPPAPPQHPAAGRGRPAQGRPLQARRIAPRTETEEICKYCGKSFPVSKLTKHLTQAHPKYYPHLRY